MGEARRRRLIAAQRATDEIVEAQWDGIIPAHVLTEADVNGEAVMLLPGGGRITVTQHGAVTVRQNADGTVTLTPG